MKANELRIGNLLLWDDQPERILKVSEIGFNKYKDRFVSFENGDGCLLDSDSGLIPIQLTEEWLVRFGFEKDRNGYALHDKMSLSIHVSKELGFVPCWSDLVLSIKYNLQYVHQLQNLYFALTGQELTFV